MSIAKGPMAERRPRTMALRAKLVTARAQSALFDIASYTRHLEMAYLTMMQRQRDSAPSAPFTVAP